MFHKALAREVGLSRLLVAYIDCRRHDGFSLPAFAERPMRPQGVQARVAEKDFDPGLGGGIPVKDRGNVLASRLD
jgi:hypothetical protein